MVEINHKCEICRELHMIRGNVTRAISPTTDTILNSYLLAAIKADLNYAFYPLVLVRRLIGADSRNSS